jgi:hypothetical protein
MNKEECEYCSDEPECTSEEHSMDCIFCECQNDYPTNFTCEFCLHDMAYCTCPEEEQQKRLNDLIQQFKDDSEEFRKQWDARLKSETE